MNINFIYGGLKNILNSYRSLRSQRLSMISNAKYQVLVTSSSFPESGIQVMRNKCELDFWDITKGLIPKEDLLKRIKGKDALFLNLTDKVDEDIIKAGSQLKVIATMSVGLDHIDVDAVRRANIRLGHTPHILTEATAELTLALLLATSRRLFEANCALKTGGWKSWSPVWMCGPGLEDSTCGIFGFGRIGKSVARKLKAFNPRHILYTGRKRSAEEEDGVEYSELGDFLRRSDFIIVTCPLTPETEKFFTYEKFCMMKPTAVFVNTARGGIVDQEALVKALKEKKIAFAGLDVMDPEPIPLDNPLLNMENVVLLPHIGSDTIKTLRDMSLMTGQNIMAALEGRPMPAEYLHKQ